MADHDELKVERRDDGTLRLTINRPARRNALSLAVLQRIGTSLEAHVDDRSLHCAVIGAAGEQCFAAGGDLRELDAIRDPDAARDMSRLGRTALDALRRFPLPVVAALNGPALGGGAELAMACDLRVAAPHAEIGFLQARLNVTPAWGGGIDLLAALGTQRALAVLAEGRRIGATEAAALGLVARVCAPGESLDDCLAAFIAPLLARPPQVLRSLKALAGAHRRTLHAQLATIEEDGFVATWVHDDHWAAAAQALAPRPAGA